MNRFAIVLVAGALVLAGCNNSKSNPAKAPESSTPAAKATSERGTLSPEDAALVKARKNCVRFPMNHWVEIWARR